MTAGEHFEAQLGDRSLELFTAIPAQMTDADKRSLLALQKAVRERSPEYAYLEIGSHLGGSIQPFLLDPRCTRIHSIDPRPGAQRDDRGGLFTYPENSTAHMMRLLSRVSPEGVSRVLTFDKDASDVPPGNITPRPLLCLIDGEHTERAALSDFSFCRRVVAENGVIAFHDANVIFPALEKIVAGLQQDRARFSAYVLPSTIFVIELGSSSLYDSQDIREHLREGHEAYLYGLRSMMHYRDVYNRAPLRMLRSVWHGFLRVRRILGAPRRQGEPGRTTLE